MKISNNQNDLNKKKSTSLPAKTVDYLKSWMMSPEHIAHPYPTEKEKSKIMTDTGIELKQLTNWFVNNRKRYWKPRVEARLKHQSQAQNTVATAMINQERRNDNIVCFNGLIPTQAESTLHHMSTGNEFPSNFLQTSYFTTPQNSSVFQGRSKFTISTGETFPVFANQRPINQIFKSNHDTCHNANSNVISTGSASSFSDCDNTTTSHLSHEDNQENNDITLQPKQISKCDRIIGQSVAHSFNVFSEKPFPVDQHSTARPAKKRLISYESPISKKRVRCVSDFDSIAFSSPTRIIARPRDLNLNIIQNDDCFVPKSRFTNIGNESEGWQNACRNASHGYDNALPTLEEAALLFGFANKN
jgi:hypothetical protein